MAVRVRLRLVARKTGRAIEVSALVNSGFETDRPQLLIPVKLAEELGLWPELPTGTSIETYGTAGGLVRLYVVPEGLEVSIKTEGTTKTVCCDALISDIEREVLISDKLGGALEIMIIDLADGTWQLRSDPRGKMRRSELPQYW